MAVDIQGLKDTPKDDDRATQLLAECRSRIGGEWRLLSSSMKLRKTILEAEYNERRVIGKASRSERSRTAFASVTKLWEAGLRPPSKFTVPEPIAWFDDLMLLVMEKASGASVLEAMQQLSTGPSQVVAAADWLACLHSMAVDLSRHRFDGNAAKTRAAELTAAIDDSRIAPTTAAAIEILATEPAVVVTSHGDYHPMNIYVSPERVTVIDFDTVALREPEADIGYFLAQTANFGLLMFDSIAATADLRRTFLDRFPDADPRRVAAHIAWTLLQSLHYDACILKIKNNKADLMMQAARSVLRTGSLDSAGA